MLSGRSKLNWTEATWCNFFSKEGALNQSNAWEQCSKMFEKIVSSQKPLTIFVKCSIAVVW